MQDKDRTDPAGSFMGWVSNLAQTHRTAPHVSIDDEVELRGDDLSADELVERAEQHVRLLFVSGIARHEV